MLGWRLLFGPLLALVFAGVLFVDLSLGSAAPLLALLSTGLALRSIWEFCDLLKVRSFRLNWPLLAILCVSVVLSNWIPHCFPSLPGPAGSELGWSMLTFGLALSILFLNAMRRYEVPGHSLETLGAEVLGLAYVAVFLSATVQLRWVHAGGLYYIPLASLVVISKCGDTAAYFVGHAVGGPKLSPRLSPGKTMAGGVGAVIGGMLGGIAWLHFGIGHFTGHRPGPWPVLALYGLVLSLSGMAGDLAESLIKRDVERKDAAALLPGFGGVLDIVDSVLFSGPIAILLWTLLPLVRG